MRSSPRHCHAIVESPNSHAMTTITSKAGRKIAKRSVLALTPLFDGNRIFIQTSGSFGKTVFPPDPRRKTILQNRYKRNGRYSNRLDLTPQTNENKQYVTKSGSFGRIAARLNLNQAPAPATLSLYVSHPRRPASPPSSSGDHHAASPGLIRFSKSNERTPAAVTGGLFYCRWTLVRAI